MRIWEKLFFLGGKGGRKGRESFTRLNGKTFTDICVTFYPSDIQLSS